MSEGRSRVLIVEDEPQIRRFVCDAVRREDCDLIEADTARRGLDAAAGGAVDLVILDLGLPDMGGIEFIDSLRTWSRVPILILSARSAEQDKIAALDAGADDYLTKPFSPRELLARIQAALRRPRASKLATTNTTANPTDEALFESMRLNTATREVSVDGLVVALTRTEFDILAAIAAAPRRVFSRRQIVDAVWGDGWGGDEHIVDVHITHLRRKIDDDASAPRFIETVRGVGYRFVAEPRP